jgi:hypothetical protein
METTTFDQRAAALRARLDAPPATTWRPDVAAEQHPSLLIGELVSQETGTTSWGEKRIAVVRDAQGQLWNVWLLHKVLIDEFARQRPAIGEMLAIRYEGRVSPASGAAYEKYRVMVDRPGVQPDWSEPGQQAAAPPVPPPFAGHSGPPDGPPPPLSPPPSVCADCGYSDGVHTSGCPGDVPF